MKWRRAKSRKSSLRSRSRLTCVAPLLAQAIPLVDRHHQRPPGLEDEAGDVRVLLGDVLPRIEHQDHDVGILDRLQGLHHRELLRRLVDLAAAAQAGGVDQRVGPPAALELDVDAVAGRAGLVEGDDALLAEEGVDQRGLADVGPADDGDLRSASPVASGCAAPRPRTAPAPAPSDRSRRRRAPPRSPAARPARARETRRRPSARPALALVDDQAQAPAGLAQLLRDRAVLGREAGAAVDQQQHRVGLGDRLQRLPRHLRGRCRCARRARARRCPPPGTALRRRARARSGGRASVPERPPRARRGCASAG